MAEALSTLRQQYETANRRTPFQILEAHDLASGDSPSYGELARQFSVNEDGVKNALRRVRADLRGYLRDRIQSTLADPSELESEMRSLFGP
jgi:DNA-directed RNA polymerase specialized sigma24 family protein